MAGTRSPRASGRALLVLLLVALVSCTWWRRPDGVPSVAQVPPAIPEDVAPEPEVEKESLGATLAAFVTKHALKVSVLVYYFCFLVAKREPAPPKEPIQAGPLEKRADYSTVLIMSAYLSLLSGIVNAVAIIEMGGTVAHHTGNASHAGRLAGSDGARFLALMVAYLVGAGVQGYCKSSGEALYRGGYSPALLSSAIAVVGGALIDYLTGNALVSLPLLSFSQGIQNAITRKCSSLPVCTTHMTGYLTDAGAGLGEWAAARGREPLSVRTKFFLISIIAFIAGGLIAKQLRDQFGVMAALVPAAFMAVTALGVIPLPAAKKSN